MGKGYFPIEDECPNCGNPKLSWMLIRRDWGHPEYSGLCTQCNSVMKNREPPEHKKGRELSEANPNLAWNDPAVLAGDCDFQIGYLRHAQGCFPKCEPGEECRTPCVYGLSRRGGLTPHRIEQPNI